jgi:Spy/CpxP family protein refolding chaperone
MNTRKAGLLTFATVVMLATIAYAGGGDGRQGPSRHGDGPGFGMPDPGMMIERVARHLDLDDAQRESVKNIMEAAKPELKALREQLRANQQALEAMDADDPEIQNIAISNGQLATEGTLLFSRIRGEVHAVLTEEQLAKAAELKEQRKNRGERWKDRR